MKTVETKPVLTKPSGIPWLGEVPAHWEVKRLAYLGEFWKGRGIARADITDEGVPAILYGDIYTQYDHKALSLVKCTTPEVAAGSEEIQSGDLLLTGSGETKEDIGKCVVYLGDEKAYAGGDVIIFRQDKADSEFLSYMLNSAFVVSQKTQMAKGEIVVHIYSSDLRDIILPLPPLPEQRAIAAFLDERTARIDALLARKRRLVQLLKEKRQALITRAVTRGLDPKVKLKESGLPFTTQVPSHWTIPRVKHVAKLQTGITLGKQFPANMKLEARPYLRVANVQDGWLKLGDVTLIELPPDDIPYYELRRGDVLMTEGGDFDKLGRGTVWEAEIDGCLHQNHIYAVRTDKSLLDPYFLSFLLSSAHGRSYFTSNKLQTTNLASTNGTIIKAFPVLLPPLDEQRAILSWLQDKLAKLDGVVAKVEAAIERLQEYRTALISAAVTGKVRVPH